MTYYALVNFSLVVDQVIVAAPEFFENADPVWLAQYAYTIEVDLSVEHDAGPGSTYDPNTGKFTRPPELNLPPL